MKFGVKPQGLWWNALEYPHVPYLFNLRMDPMERFDQESHEWGYASRKLFAEKMWTMVPAQGIIAEHLASLTAFPPRQRAESLSIEKSMKAAMDSLQNVPGQAE